MFILAACSSSTERAARARDEGEAFAARGQYFAARERFDTAVGLRDDQPELWIARARNQVTLGDYGGAFGSYSSALELDRTNREALDAVGQIALLAGRTAEAERIANQILTLAPDDAAALYVKGSVQLQGGRLEAAAGTIEQGLRGNPTDENLLALKSRLLADRGDLSQAIDILKPAFDAKSANPLVLGQLADVYGRQYSGREVLLVRARAARTSPDDAVALYAFGKQLLASGMLGDGVKMVELSIERQKKQTDKRSMLLALAEGDVDADLLAQAFTTQPVLRPTTRLDGARYALLADRPIAARAILLQAPPAERGDDWSALMAYLLAGRGSMAAASEISRLVLRKDAHSNLALAARALIAGSDRRLDEALRDARLAASDAPRQVEPMVVLATIFTLKGDAEAARAVRMEAFNRNRDNILFLRALVGSGRNGAAISEMLPLVRDFTVRNPAILAGWVVRKSICLAARQSACANRAGAIAKGLAGKVVTIPPPPAEERIGRSDG